MENEALNVNAELAKEPLQEAPASSPEPKLYPDKKSPHFIAPFAVLALVIVAGFVYWLMQGGMLGQGGTPGFNIPNDGEYILLVDGGTLYAFNTENERMSTLGTFKDEGTPITSTLSVSLSPDLSHAVVSVPHGVGSEVLSFTSFTESKSVVDVETSIHEIAVSNKGAVTFIVDGSGVFVYDSSDESIESLGEGTTPFYLGDTSAAVIGTQDGFRMYDLSAHDVLDTETPSVPLAQVMRPSATGSSIALISDAGTIHTFKTLSARPFNLIEASFLVIPGGAYDAAVLDDKKLAFLSLEDGGAVLLSTQNLVSKELTKTELSLSSNTQLIGWTK